MRVPHTATEHFYFYFPETVTNFQLSAQLPPISNPAKNLLKLGQISFLPSGIKGFIAKVRNGDQLPSITIKSLAPVNGSPSHCLSTDFTLEILILSQLDKTTIGLLIHYEIHDCTVPLLEQTKRMGKRQYSFSELYQ